MERAKAVGDVAPDFSLPGSVEREWSLSNAVERGPVVVLFYRGHWCRYCRKQLGELQQSLKEFERRGASLVAISVDDLGKTRALAQDLGITFPLLSDVNLEVTRAWGLEDPGNAIPWPAMYIVTRDGRIAWRSLEETYKVRPSSEVVLEALDEVMRAQ